MRSPADGLRAALEGALRSATFALMAFAFWALAVGASGIAVRVDGDAFIDAALPSAKLDGALATLVATSPDAVHVLLEAPPAPVSRDALRAMSHAGTRVTWSGAGLVPLAVAAERLREPSAPVRVAVTSSDDVELRDGLDLIDTLHAARGATIVIGAPSGAVLALASRARAVTVVPAATALKPVLVLGHASWEAKFAVAALEEDGWTVDARLAVAPAADVTQGTPGTIDTSRYAAVIALDSMLGVAGAQLPRFVHDGGGLLLLADAANAAAVRAIAPARVGTRRSPATRDLESPVPLDALPLYPLESLRADVVRLAARGSLIAAAARREGAGRVVQAGYEETWRWRMQGGDGAVAAHREWWSRSVGSVAAAPLPLNAPPGAGEGAPLARLVHALGPPVIAPPVPAVPRRVPAWLPAAVLALLLAEWASRRTRGAP